MNNLSVRLLAMLPLLALACEGPKRTNKKDKPEPVAEAPKEKEVSKEQEVPKPPEEIFSATRTIDGRKQPPQPEGSPSPIDAIRNYSFGQVPEPKVPPETSIQIEPLKDPLQAPVVRKAASVRSVAMTNPSLAWEVAMLRRGIDVLDRSSMQLLEREVFLQEANLQASGAAQKDIVGPPLVGRDNIKIPPGHNLVWLLQQDRYYPLLNGRSVDNESRIQVGRHLAAQAILEASDFDITASSIELDASRPTAKQIEYMPKVLTTVAKPEHFRASWRVEESDPFHAKCKDGPVYFDPQSRALWTLSEAWAGHEVSREDYIARRTSTTRFYCPGCARELADKAVTSAPSAAETPLRWKCAACDDIRNTRYLDGYAEQPSADNDISVTIRPTWIAPRAGSYPVLSASEAVRGLLRASAHWVKFDAATLDANASATALGLPPNHDWCHIDEARLATVVSHSEIQKLVGYFGPDSQPDGKFLVPAVDAEGAQIYVLSTEATTKQTFQVPVASVEVQVRAVGVEDARLLCAGVLRLSYLNLLDKAVELPVTAEGLDASKWPTLKQQSEALRHAACERVAGMLKP